MADLLDRRMMSLYGINQNPVNKLDVQNTSRNLQKAQNISKGGHKSPDISSIDASSPERLRASLTIGLNKTF